VIHGLNLGLAAFLAIDATANQCVWYFNNLIIDTTLGTALCYVMLKILNVLAKRNNWRNLKSGLYYEEISIDNGKTHYLLKPKMYFFQLLAWVFIVVIVKFI
jgi:hypothetical protein